MDDDPVGGDWGWVIIPEVLISLFQLAWTSLLIVLHGLWALTRFIIRRWLRR